MVPFLHLLLLKLGMRQLFGLIDQQQILRVNHGNSLLDILHDILFRVSLKLGLLDGSKGRHLAPADLLKLLQHYSLAITANHFNHLLDLQNGMRLIHTLQKEAQLLHSNSTIIVNINSIKSLPDIIICK